MNKKIVMLCSGGIDSSVCCIYFKNEGYEVYPLFINYGQNSVESEWEAVLSVCNAYSASILIIDTKYYEHTMQQNRFGDGRTLHSHNMYQIYTYVKNKDTTHSGKVSGVLLYAKTDEEIVPDHDYVIGGNRISVITLDLNSTFPQIAKQLDALAERLLY
jgi:Predicted PP-loop superfamily ATPase